MKNKKTLKIEPIPVPDVKPEDVLGYELFPDLYGTIVTFAKRKSGKTTVLFEIFQHCINETTTIFIFASTHEVDANWLYIKQWLTENKINFECFTDLDALDGIVTKLCQPAGKSDEKPKELDIQDLFTCAKVVTKTPKKPEEKKKKGPIAPQYMFIFDDMSALMRNESVSRLMKMNRHIKSKTVVSSQYPNDLNVPARQQASYWLLFKGHPLDKLEQMYRIMDLSIEFLQFIKMYIFATTSVKFGFLYVDTQEGTFRRCFDTPIDPSRYVD